MKSTVTQKMGLSFIYGILGFFVFLDKYGMAFYSISLNFARLFALFFIFGSFLSFTTKLLVKPGEMFDYMFYYPIYENYGLTIRQKLPNKIAEVPVPAITAESAIAVDVTSSKVLFELNPDKQLPPASTTKVMTFLTAYDLYKADQKLEVLSDCTMLDSQKAGFYPQEQVSVKDLYYALLINSAGDAAYTLSAQDPQFISLMNKKAQVLGLSSTRFSNAVGFDNYEAQVSTARDLVKLGIVAMQNSLTRDIVKTKTLQINSSGTPHILTNTNKLLWEVPESVGLRTGTTDGAGEVLIYMYETDNKRIAIVVMQSSDRFSDTKKILDWVLKSYTWEI